MAILTISRGSYSMGKAVAEKVAANLGYRVISRDLLLKASDKFHTPEQTLLRAIHDAPGMLERYNHTRQIYMAYIRSALLEMIAGDDVVYHGLAGHLLLKGLDHVLKIRIIANLEGRIARKMKDERLIRQNARAMILEDDKQRRKWTHKIYGVDPRESSLYDIVICIDKLLVDNAVELICHAARTKAFETTESCLQKLRDLALACNIKAALVEDYPEVGVTCEYGNLLVYITEKNAHSRKLKAKLDSLERSYKEIHNLEVHTGLPVLGGSV